MNRRTLIAGLVLAGLIIATVLMLRSPEKGTRPSDEAVRPIPKLAADSFDTLEVTKGKVTTVIKKAGDAYEIEKPQVYPADRDAAKPAFEAVSKLDFGNVVSDQKSHWDEFELGNEGLRLVIRKGDKALADLRIGKTTNQMTMVRLEGTNDVWSTTGIFKHDFDKDANAWRDRTITRFEENDAERLQVTSKGGARIVLAKPVPRDGGAAPEWQVAESSVKVEPFDKTTATSVISQLASWKANDFADDAQPKETGLDSPELTVTVTLRGGKQETVLIGNKKGDDDWYVKRTDQPQVFLVKRFNLERVNKRPIDFRDKTICTLESGELTEVSVARKKDPFSLIRQPTFPRFGSAGQNPASPSRPDKQGGAWKATKPAGITLDEGTASAIAGAFSEWKGQGFARDNSLKATGLNNPTATITAKSRVKGHGCQLKIGAETSDKSNYYVQVDSQPDVFEVAKGTVERVLVKLDDLKKK